MPLRTNESMVHKRLHELHEYSTVHCHICFDQSIDRIDLIFWSKHLVCVRGILHSKNYLHNCNILPSFAKRWDSLDDDDVGGGGLHSSLSCSLFSIVYFDVPGVAVRMSSLSSSSLSSTSLSLAKCSLRRVPSIDPIPPHRLVDDLANLTFDGRWHW